MCCLIFFKFFLFFIFFICSIKSLNSAKVDNYKKNQQDYHSLVRELIKNLYGYVTKNSNKSIIFNDILSNFQCFVDMSKLSLYNDDTFWDDITSNTGLGQGDDGYENDCIKKNNLTYLFITYKIDNSGSIAHEENLYNFYAFLENSNFFTGLCLMKDCQSFYYSFFNRVQNKQFYDKFYNDYGIYQVKLYYMNYLDSNNISVRENQLRFDNKKINAYLICIWSLIIYLILRCLITFSFTFYESSIEQYNFYDIEIDNSDSKEKIFEKKKIKEILELPNCYAENEIFGPSTMGMIGSIDSNDEYKHDNYFDSSSQVSINEIVKDFYLKCDYQSAKHKTKAEKIFEFSNFRNIKAPKSDRIKNGLFYKYFKICSLKNNLKILISPKIKTKYFDDTNLEIFRGMRFFLFLLLTINQSLSDLEKLPKRYFSGFTFYTSLCFFIVKYSTYASISLIVINGIFLGFKLMNYTKKNGNQFNFKEMLIFIFKFIPPFLYLLFSFLFLHYFIKEIGYFIIGNGTVFDYFVNKNILNKWCINEPFKIFNPIFFNYWGYEPDHSFGLCYRYIYFVLSEFYCFLFFIILFYILNKIRHKKLDSWICALSFLILPLCYFLHDDNYINKFYTIRRVMGEVYTIQKPYLFFFPYFMGINIGIMWFYYKDLNTSNPIFIQGNNDAYQPFLYNFFIMKFFDKKSHSFKFYMLLSTTLLTVLLSFSFNFIIWVNSKCNCISDILVPYNSTLRLFFIYENKIFLLLNSLYIISFIFYNKELSLKNILSSNLFTPVNKIAFTYFCSNDFIIYIFYSSYNVHIYNNIVNELTFSLALFTFIFGFSCFCVILFELPLRLIFQIIFTRKTDEFHVINIKKIDNLKI